MKPSGLDGEPPWDELPIAERVRDCFAEAEVAMEEASQLLGTAEGASAGALADLARQLHTTTANVRARFDAIAAEQDPAARRGDIFRRQATTMREIARFPPPLRCPRCQNDKPPSLSIATGAYWIYPEWRVQGTNVVVSFDSGEVNLSGGPGITYYLMCRRILCGAITPLPSGFRVKFG